MSIGVRAEEQRMWRGGWSALQDACVQLNSIKKEISSILPAGCRLPALRGGGGGGVEEIKERGNVHYRLWPYFSHLLYLLFRKLISFSLLL